jgi:hypothetical protein
MSWLWLLSFLLLIIIPVIARNQLSKEIDQNEIQLLSSIRSIGMSDITGRI